MPKKDNRRFISSFMNDAKKAESYTSPKEYDKKWKSVYGLVQKTTPKLETLISKGKITEKDALSWVKVQTLDTMAGRPLENLAKRVHEKEKLRSDGKFYLEDAVWDRSKVPYKEGEHKKWHKVLLELNRMK